MSVWRSLFFQAWGGSWSYEYGPINGSIDSWYIDFGFTVSDSYLAAGTSVNGFAFGVRELPGDNVTSVDWVLSTGPCSDLGSGCGTIVGAGTASGNGLTDEFLFTNEFGYDIDLITVSNLNVPEINGSEYWLTLANAVVPSGNPVGWDENQGIGCHSPDCPSMAYENTVGTILKNRSQSAATAGPSRSQQHSAVRFGARRACGVRALEAQSLGLLPYGAVCCYVLWSEQMGGMVQACEPTIRCTSS